jgi:hypothetical protein
MLSLTAAESGKATKTNTTMDDIQQALPQK